MVTLTPTIHFFKDTLHGRLKFHLNMAEGNEFVLLTGIKHLLSAS